MCLIYVEENKYIGTSVVVLIRQVYVLTYIEVHTYVEEKIYIQGTSQ